MADVESLQLQITGDAKGAKDSLDALIKTLDRLKTATSGGCGLSAVSDGLQKVGNSGKNASASNAKSAKSFVNLGAKVTAAAFALKKAGKVIASWIKESNDYIENVNLFSVAMGGYADSAKEYAEEVSDLMGIDPSDWMRNQGVFMTLATGFGVAGDRAATMSQQLTQLGYDISSFYNTSVEDAMTKLQSGISGELEPLRRLGYDLSQAKLEATALSLGIDKSVSSMTQAEKAELRYYAIMTQVTTAQGDMARTLEAPANQLRVLQAQATQAARALGDLFLPALNAILPVAIAVLKVITALAKIIARLFGADVQENISSSMGNLASNAGNASEEIDAATGSAKKLKKMLLGIDELNVMPDTSGGSGSDDALGGGGFDFELPTYDFIGDLTETRVAEIVEDMMEWLGITEDITSWSELMDTNFGNILKTVGLIAAGIGGWKIFTLIESLKGTELGEIFKDTGKLKTGGGAIMGVVGAVMQLMGAWDAWENGMDWQSLGEQIGGIGIAIAGLAIAVGHIGVGIASIIGGIILTATSIKDWIENGVDWDNFVGVMVGLAAIFGGISTLVGSWIPMAVGAVVATVVAIIMWWDQISAFFTNLWGVIVTWCGDACAAIGQFFVDLWQSICDIWGAVAEWFDTNVIQPVVGFFVGLWEEISTTASTCWNAIVEFFTPAYEWFAALFGSIFQTISDIFYNIGVIASGCWEIIKAVWAIVAEWFDTNVIQPVESAFQYVWESIVSVATKAWTKITSLVVTVWSGIRSTLSAAYTWIDTKIIQPVSAVFSNLWNGFLEKAKLAWAGVKSVFGKVATFFKETFQKAWAGVVAVFSVAGEIFVKIKDGIVEAFKKVVNGLIKGLNSVIAVPFNGINLALRKIRDISILGLTPFSNLKTISIPSIPYLADGGVVAAGQMFVANEAGPELVGNVGNRTAVVNNDQIVESVSKGVYRAVVQAMGQSGGTQVVEAKVNDKVLFEVVVDRNRRETMRTGASPLLGGV